MKKKAIADMIEPFVVNHQLKYDDFASVYEAMYSSVDREALTNYLLDHDIHFVYEILPDTENNETENFFEDTQDLETASADDYGQDDDYGDEEDKDVYWDEYPLEIKGKIRHSNEALCSLIQQGSQQARLDLCTKNKNLIWKMAHRYQKNAILLDAEDLSQCGYIGLLNAAERFDKYRGCQFTSYAAITIKYSMWRAIETEDLVIRLPVRMRDKIYKIIKCENRLAAYGIDDANERYKEIAEICDMGISEVRRLMVYYDGFCHRCSLDAPVNKESDTPLVEFMIDEKAIDPVKCVCEKCMQRDVKRMLEALSEKERKLLRLRFGIDDGRKRTLEEVGQHLGLSRERICQIEKKALDKLRKKCRRQYMEEYLEE